MSTPNATVNMALEIFPTDVAEELKLFAEKHSWGCAKLRSRQYKRKDADKEKSEAERHLASFKEKCEGLLSDTSFQAIESMLGYSSWHAANTRKSEHCWRRGSRKGYESDASNDKREVEEGYQNIVREGEISETLAKNVKEMGWSAPWFAANTIFGHQEDAERQKENLDSCFDKIHGEVNIAEILSQRPIARAVSEENEESGDIEALDIFPLDIAKELKGYAAKAASHCAKMRLGNRGEADADKIESKNHFDSFKDKCKGLLSDKSCEDIKSMLWYTSWHAANTTKSKRSWQCAKRNRYKSDAASDERVIQAKFQDVVSKGEISEALATNVKEMGWNAAWYAALTIVGRRDDALRDKANLDSYFDRLHGDVNLVAMNFIMDEAKILSQKPKVVSEKDLVNRGDVEQTMSFSFSMTEGRTRSTSHTFSAGFAGFAECNFQVSFSFSHSHTFAQSTSTGTTTTFEFPLSVPAHSIYVAKGIVYEAEMDIPYELVLDFEGTRRTVRGRWKGVACSKATYEVAKKEDPLPPDQADRENDIFRLALIIISSFFK
ncbi:uncharacterized protein LOC144654019 [Oculina patagonica]